MGERLSSSTDRVLGGSPFSVLLRLVVLSFVVGLIMHVLGIDPRDIVLWAEYQIRALSNFSFGAVEDVIRILALGAVVVVPIWLVMRVLRLISR